MIKVRLAKYGLASIAWWTWTPSGPHLCPQETPNLNQNPSKAVPLHRPLPYQALAAVYLVIPSKAELCLLQLKSLMT